MLWAGFLYPSGRYLCELTDFYSGILEEVVLSINFSQVNYASACLTLTSLISFAKRMDCMEYQSTGLNRQSFRVCSVGMLWADCAYYSLL